MKLIATKFFKAALVLEYSISPAPTQLGNYDNQMSLYVDECSGYIEWEFKSKKDYGCEEIGLRFEGKKVTDYDGVFSLPVQAIQLLEEKGYDCSEVKED